MYNFDDPHCCVPIGNESNLIYTDCAYTLYSFIALPLLLYIYYVYVLGISELEFYKDINSFFFDIHVNDFEVYQDYGLKPLHHVKSYGDLPDTSIKEFQETLKKYIRNKKHVSIDELDNSYVHI